MTQAFISYSHDSKEHKNAVLVLANLLRHEGVDVTLDQYMHGTPPEGWPKWMMNRIREADFVLCVCTDKYRRRFEGTEAAGIGLGAKWEGAIVTQAIYEADGKNTRFLPVLIGPDQLEHRPVPLRAPTYYEVHTPEGYDRLYRVLTNQPAVIPPPVGQVRKLPPAAPAGPQAVAWDIAWTTQCYEAATRNPSAAGIPGFMIAKSVLIGHQLNARLPRVREVAMRVSRVQCNYSSLIGLYSHNPAQEPQVLDAEVVSTLSRVEKGQHQYWAIRTNGSYFYLTSLVEDVREISQGSAPGQTLDWVSRIIRVAEVLLYCGRLYRGFEVPDTAHVQIEIAHTGLLNRHLVAEGTMFNASIHRHVSYIGENSYQVIVPLEALAPAKKERDSLIVAVKTILEPLFERFNGYELPDDVYGREVAKIADALAAGH